MNRSKPFRYLLITLLFMMLAGCSQELSEKQDTPPPTSPEPAALETIMVDNDAANPAEPELSATAEDVGGSPDCDSEFIFNPTDKDFQIGACDDLDVTFTLFAGSDAQVFKGSYPELISFCGEQPSSCVASLRADINSYKQRIENSDLNDGQCLARVGRQSRRLLDDNEPRRLRFLAIGATSLAAYGIGQWGIKLIENDAASAAASVANLIVLMLGYEKAVQVGRTNLANLSDEGLAAGIAGFVTLSNYARRVFRASQNQPQLLPVVCPTSAQVRAFVNRGPYRGDGELRR